MTFTGAIFDKTRTYRYVLWCKWKKLIQANNTTGYRGIVFEPKKQLYRVQIGYKYRRIRGGRFKSAIDAARRYNELAIKYFGNFAKLNPV